MSAVITPQARQDLVEILRRIQDDNPLAAEKMAEEFIKKFRLLSAFPGIGTAQKNSDLGVLLVKHNYRVHYRVPPPELRIERVVHVARNWSGEGLPA